MDTMTELDLPDWLTAPVDELPKFPRTKVEREVEHLTFEALFERVLEGITEGRSAKGIVEDDPRNITYGRFYQWIRKDPERLRRYEEAQEASAEILLEEMQQIADGEGDIPEDVQRSNLRINVRKFRVQAYNRKRYGDKQVVDVTNNTTVSIRNLLDEREKKLAQLSQNVIEGEATRVE
jgi:hypothetical protein